MLRRESRASAMTFCSPSERTSLGRCSLLATAFFRLTWPCLPGNCSVTAGARNNLHSSLKCRSKITVEKLFAGELRGFGEGAHASPWNFRCWILALSTHFACSTALLNLRHQSRELRTRLNVEQFALPFLQRFCALIPSLRQVAEHLVALLDKASSRYFVTRALSVAWLAHSSGACATTASRISLPLSINSRISASCSAVKPALPAAKFDRPAI